MRKLLALLLVCAPAFATFTNQDKAFIEIKNLLKNPGAEAGKADLTASAGTFATTTTAANVGNGAVGFSWDGSATGQTLTTGSYTVPAGLYGRNCLARALFKTTETTVPYVLEALDGSNNVLGSQTLTGIGTFTPGEASFICPSSGSIKLRVRTNSSAGNPAIVYLDDLYLGSNYLVSNYGTAQLVGTLEYAATSSCAWTSNSSSYGDFSADSDCPTPTVTGSVVAPGTKVPHALLNSAPPGVYLVIVQGAVEQTADNGFKPFRLFEGTTSTSMAEQDYRSPDNGGGEKPLSFVGTINNTTTQNLVFKMQCKTGTGNCILENSVVKSNWAIYRFPTVSQQAISIDQAGWRIDANITGANPSMGTSAVTSYTGIENGSLTMTQNAGSATAWIPCSSTNDSSGTTCSAGNESVGVSFTIPYAGDYMACASFSHVADVGGASVVGRVTTTFQVVETPNAAQTISQEGKTRVVSGNEDVSTNQRQITTSPHRLCGTFTFASVGRKTLRVMYEQFVAGTPNDSTLVIDSDSSHGQRDFHWEVYPISRAWPMPLIVGGVSSNTTGQERVERAVLTCSGSSSVTTQSGAWISSVGNVSSGACTITLPAGQFTAAPTCTANANDTTSTPIIIATAAASATSISVDCATDGGTACTSYSLNLHCMGPK